MDKYKALFFDADGTLVNHKECEKQALVYLFDHIGAAYKNEYQELFRPLDHMLWETGLHTDKPVPIESVPTYRFKVFFEEIDIKYDDYAKANELFKTGLANSSALIKNTETIIEYLYNRGYLLCVVTNGLTELQKPRISKSNIGKYISHIIVSEEVGEHKPNQLIFNTLLKRININPCDVLMIGDSLKNDIQGARNAGIKSVWYNPIHQTNKTEIIPDYEIDDLMQLKDML